MTKVAIYVCGGLGNQLFQFACLYSYCKNYGYKPIFDRKFHGELHTKDLFWEQFQWKDIFPQDSLSGKFWTYQEDDSVFQPIPPHSDSDILLKGYYNNEKYFIEHKDEIRRIFQEAIYTIHPKEEIKERVGIHIRRGDYLKYKNVFYTLEEGFYQKALKILPTEEKVVVTEAIDWAKNVPAEEYRNESILEDFHYLMHCKHIVIANSTFSWWAAYLSNTEGNIYYPLEWFKDPRLIHCYKYGVKGWRMLTSKNKEEIHQLLNFYIVHRNWDAFTSIFFYLKDDFTPYQLEIFNIYDIKNARKNAEVLQENILQSGISIEGYYRKNLHTLLGSQSELFIDMKKIPHYVIAGEERKEIMKRRFQEKGLEPIFFNPVCAAEKAEGCGKAHINALEKAIERGVYPFIIYEDDILFTDSYQENFILPKITDAFYLGMSRYGMGGWNQMGIRKHILLHEDIHLGGNQFYQIKNMLSAHAILYVNERYARKVLALIKACLTMKFINDVGTARAQEESNVLCMAKPFVVQDVALAKNKHQKQNNMETYVSVKEFNIHPIRKKLLI